MKTPDKIKFDRDTQRWFDLNPDAVTTIRRCDKCGLWYKTGIRHKCDENTITVSAIKDAVERLKKGGNGRENA
jgi:hypothetical protein